MESGDWLNNTTKLYYRGTSLQECALEALSALEALLGEHSRALEIWADKEELLLIGSTTGFIFENSERCRIWRGTTDGFDPEDEKCCDNIFNEIAALRD